MNNVEKFEKFIVSQKGLLIREDKALIVRMAKYPDKWDLPGGHIDKREDARLAFRREIEEETGVKEFRNLGVTHYHIWYLSDGRPYQGICNLIVNGDTEIKLSSEHLEYKWIEESEIDNFDYIWPEMHIMIKEGFKKNKKN